MKALALQPADMMRLMQAPWFLRLIKIVNLLLVVWVAWLLASLTWELLPAEEKLRTVTPEAAPAPGRVDRSTQLIRQLPGWHLLGEAKRATAPANTTAPLDAPDTRLKLVLRGVLSSDDPENARAIIANPGGREEQYAIGEQLPGNAELSEIYPDRVILMRNGRYETLRLPRDDASKSPARSSRASRRSTGSTTQRLGSLRKQLKKNPRSLYGLVRTIPKKDDTGALLGYSISPGSDPELFNQMGLQAGDVVVQVNDVRLDDLKSGLAALRSVQSGDSVTLAVLRDGIEQGLSFSVPE